MQLEKKPAVAVYLGNVRFAVFCVLAAFITTSKAVAEITIGITLFLWLIENIIVNKRRIKDYFPKTELNLPLAVLAAALFASVFHSVEFQLSLRKFFGKWGQYIILYFLAVSSLDSKKKLKTILWLLSIGLFLVLINGFWQAYSGRGFLLGKELDGAFWLTSCYVGLSPFGSVIILLAPVVVSFLALYSNKLIAAYKFLLIGLASVCLLLSGSITSWIALSGSIAVALFTSQIKKRKILIFLIFLSIMTGLVLFIPSFKNRLVGSIYNTIYSDTGRLAIWRENIEEIKRNPILGKGINTTTVEIAGKYSKLPLVVKANPHSLYLTIALEAGLLGLCAYLWVVFRAFLMTLSVRKHILGCGLLIGLTAFFLINVASTIWYERIQNLFWVTLGLTAAVKRLKIENGWS